MELREWMRESRKGCWNMSRCVSWKWIVVMLVFCLGLGGCGGTSEKEMEQGSEVGCEKFEAEFIGTFDVKIQVIGYSESEENFTEVSNVIYDEMHEMNELFDIYNDYDGVANLKTINDNAGVRAVEVDQRIIDLLLFSKEAYEKTDGLTNIAMGATLKVWHEYRTQGIQSPENATLPLLEELEEANEHTNIEDIMIDEENCTVYLKDSRMSIDVGAVAKGYAAQEAKELAVQAGLESGVMNAGGNVLTIGTPKDGVRERWGIGLQDPKKAVEGVTNILDTVYLNDMAVVSSGDYQRYYEVDGKTYHHIIDPQTLFPADRYAAVTVIHEDSGVADYLSTAIFIASYEKGVEIAKANQAEVLWVYQDGHTEATDGYQAISKMYSGYSSTEE